ncbi:MAG: cobalamin B12-binding domain-containing protein [Proteobacteria bacterium]|nr:cobalamin B12-binding domain-containing protein [Pseudomonadota bacterium]
MSGLSQQGASGSIRSEQGGFTLDAPQPCRSMTTILKNERSPLRRQAAIERVVETDIIPRLLAAYRARAAAGVGEPPAAGPTPTPSSAPAHSIADATALAASVMGPEPEAAVALVVARLLEQGEAAEASCLELIADAARHLGTLWEDDRASFAEVTLGMFHLQRMVHDIAPMTRRRTVAPGAPPRTFLLLTLEGEQHSLAKTILANCFDSAGWQVSTRQVAGTDDVASLVSAIDYDVVGFSIPTDVVVSRADQCIKAVRQASHNKNVVIMVGGALILATPSLVESLGADGTAASAAEATVRAEELLNQLRRPEVSPSSAIR